MILFLALWGAGMIAQVAMMLAIVARVYVQVAHVYTHVREIVTRVREIATTHMNQSCTCTSLISKVLGAHLFLVGAHSRTCTPTQV